jgi:hypothetical protein
VRGGMLAVSGDRWHDVGVPKISTDEQQRFTGGLRQRVGKTIAEIQLGRMSAAFAEIPISLSSKPGLTFRDRLDAQACHSEQVIKAAAGDGIAAAMYDDGTRLFEIQAEHLRGNRQNRPLLPDSLCI